MDLKNTVNFLKSSRFQYGVLIAVCLAVSIFAMSLPRVERMNNGLNSHIKTVILDAGHGGFDGGARGVDGTEEKDINLQITLKTAAVLRMLGYDVITVRTEDVGVNDPDAETIRQKKNSDLHNRLDLANNTPNSIFISIHQNKFSDARSRGAQMFYSPGHPDSKLLSEYIYKYAALISPENDRGLKESGKNIFLLYNAQNPATLMECGFLSNWEDSAILKTDEYQKKLALCVAFGVSDYFNPKKPSPSNSQE